MGYIFESDAILVFLPQKESFPDLLAEELVLRQLQRNTLVGNNCWNILVQPTLECLSLPLQLHRGGKRQKGALALRGGRGQRKVLAWEL